MEICVIWLESMRGPDIENLHKYAGDWQNQPAIENPFQRTLNWVCFGRSVSVQGISQMYAFDGIKDTNLMLQIIDGFVAEGFDIFDWEFILIFL